MSSNGFPFSPGKMSAMALTEERLQDIEEKKEFLEVLYGEAKEYLSKADEGVFVASQVMDIVEQSNKIIESEMAYENTKVSVPLMDVKVLSAAVDSLKLNANSMDVNSQTFDSKEFAEKMLPLLQPGNRDTLLAYSDNCMRVPVPSYSFLFGTYAEEEEPPPKIPVRKNRRSQPEPMEIEKKRPENVARLDQEETEIQKILRQMMKVLHEESERNGGKPISYFHFIVDPDSFSRTIENMFHVAFLVRDGEVSLTLDKEQDLLVLFPVGGSQRKARERNTPPRQQMILQMTIDDWKYLIDEFEIEEAMFTPIQDRRF